MEMSFFKLRVSVQYQEEVETLILTFEANEERLIFEAQALFGIPEEDWNEFELLLLQTRSRIKHSSQLFQDDVLLLRKKNSSFSKNNFVLEGSEEFDISKEFRRLSISSWHQETQSQKESNNNQEDISEDISTIWSYRDSEPQDDDEVSEADQTDNEPISPSQVEEGKDDLSLPEQEGTKIKIDVESLLQAKFENRIVLKEKIDLWSSDNKMGLVFKSQERENLDGSRVSILYCDKKKKYSCPFYLEFKMNKEDKFYKLKNYWPYHNHDLYTYDGSGALTEEIISKIKILRPYAKSYQDLCQAINKECNKNFYWRVIYYQAKKIEEEEIGHPTKDAQNLIKILKWDSKNRGGFYNAEFLNIKLEKFCYMSNRMKLLINKFEDVIIIDGSYKINRFNMPVVDIAVIDNHGRTSTCFFALISDNKYESYLWILTQLKSQLSKIPKIIFSDEEED